MAEVEATPAQQATPTLTWAWSLGALVSAHSLVRNSAHADAFDVKIIWLEDHPFFERYEGREYLRGGGWRPWPVS